MFEARNRIFQKSFDPELELQEREAFSVTLRKQKRLETIFKKRLFQANPPTHATTEYDTEGLEMLLIKLEEKNSRNDVINIWRCVLNLTRVIEYNCSQELENKLFSVISTHLNFNSPVEAQETITSLICDISHLPDNHTESLNKHGIIECLSTILDSPNLKIKENAIWSLTNMLASNLNEIKNKIIELGFIKKLIKNVHLHQLHNVISWSVKTISVLSDVIHVYHANKIPNICKIILDGVELTDDICSNVIWALGFSCRIGSECVDLVFERGLADKMINMFSSFPLECSSLIVSILIKDQLKGKDLIRMKILDELDEVLSPNNSHVAAKVFCILEKLCRLGNYAVSSIFEHNIYSKSIRISVKLNETAQICWGKYIETLATFSPHWIYESIINEELEKTTFKVYEFAGDSLKVRCLRIFELFIKLWGEEKFCSTPEGFYISSQMDEYGYKFDMIDENSFIRLIENFN